MKLKTLKDFDGSRITGSKKIIPNIIKGELKEEAIKVFKDILKHNKNPFLAFKTFFNIEDEDLK